VFYANKQAVFHVALCEITQVAVFRLTRAEASKQRCDGQTPMHGATRTRAEANAKSIENKYRWWND
jgi:hypothetical protein